MCPSHEGFFVISCQGRKCLNLFFPNFITTSKPKNLLQNLEFYQVEWQLEEMKSLEVLLEGSLSVNQLAFKANRLNADCMAELSKILRKNDSIKEIILSESRIGSFGATLIASALKVNSCLTELQIWEDSIGSKGAEELSKMIEANSTLKLLTIFDSSSITATPLISAVLARNRSIEVHLWSRESHNRNNTSKVVEFAPESSTLRIYRLTTSGACRVAGALGWNTTVKSVDLTSVRLRSRWAKETLRADDNRFGGIGVEHLLCPLTRFSSIQIQGNVTLKSITFGGRRTKVGREGLVAILQMLSTNQSVTRLRIHEDQSLRPQDIIRIFKSLERNASLKWLSQNNIFFGQIS